MDTNLYGMEKTALTAYLQRRNSFSDIQFSQKELSQQKTDLSARSAIHDFSEDQERDNNKALFSVDSEGNAHIPIAGILGNNFSIIDLFSGEGFTSYSFIIAASLAAESSDEVKKIIFDVNSPGGAMDGVDQASQVIANLTKPTEARVSFMAASAAYYLTSQVGRIVAEVPNVLIGSIGVMRAQIIDKDVQIITSTDAPNKNPDFSTAKGKKTAVGELDDIHDIFVQRIIEGRSKAIGRQLTVENINSDFGKGGLKIASKALESKMIDSLENRVLKSDKDNSDNNRENINLKSTEAATIKTEEKIMGLKETLATNPEISGEIEGIKKKAFTEGEARGKAIVEARVDGAMKFMGSASQYPAFIQDFAAKVIHGKNSADVLEGMIATYDASEEGKRSRDAKEETEKQGDITAEHKKDSGSTDGVIRTQEDEAEVTAQLMKLTGRGKNVSTS